MKPSRGPGCLSGTPLQKNSHLVSGCVPALVDGILCSYAGTNDSSAFAKLCSLLCFALERSSFSVQITLVMWNGMEGSARFTFHRRSDASIICRSWACKYQISSRTSCITTVAKIQLWLLAYYQGAVDLFRWTTLFFWRHSRPNWWSKEKHKENRINISYGEKMGEKHSLVQEKRQAKSLRLTYRKPTKLLEPQNGWTFSTYFEVWTRIFV